MARSSKRATKKSTKRQATTAALAKLRKAGLISKTAYRGKPSGSAYKTIRKYQDVLEGRAVAVTPKTKLIPKALKTRYKFSRGKLIIPKPKGTISTTITRGKKGVSIKRTRKTARGLTREEVTGLDAHNNVLRSDEVYRVTMPNWNGESARYYKNQADLDAFLDWYDNLPEWLDISKVRLKDTPYFNDTFGPILQPAN